MHAIHSSYNDKWRSFFHSRRSFGHLKLTADLGQEGNTGPELSESRNHAHANSCLQSIPLDCDSLEVDASMSSELPLYTEQPPRLKQLTVQAADLQWHLADLRQLTHLSTLEVIDNKEGAGLIGLGICLHSAPLSLQRLLVSGRWTGYGSRPYDVAQLVPLSLRLSHLHLEAISVTFVNSSIACLNGLISLSFSDSIIVADWDNLSQLTNLTMLDLSCATCVDKNDEDVEFQEEPFTLPTFTAWSNLRILKIVQCDLFDKKTVFDHLGVVEVHASHVLLNVPGHQLRLHAEW